MSIQTKWKRKYRPRFSTKYSILNNERDKYDIKEHTIKIANHSDPNNIGGCATCPGDDFKKLEFRTGWVIFYKFDGTAIHFLTFERKI